MLLTANPQNCKTGTSVRKSSLMPCVWASLQIPTKHLLQPEGKGFYSHPRHNMESKNHLDQDPPSTHKCLLSTAAAAEVKAACLPPHGCFASFPFHVHPYLGCRLIWLRAFEQKHQEVARTMGWELSLSSTLRFIISNCVTLVPDSQLSYTWNKRVNTSYFLEWGLEPLATGRDFQF